jgi:hypothetical protein
MRSNERWTATFMGSWVTASVIAANPISSSPRKSFATASPHARYDESTPSFRARAPRSVDDIPITVVVRNPGNERSVSVQRVT